MPHRLAGTSALTGALVILLAAAAPIARADRCTGRSDAAAVVCEINEERRAHDLAVLQHDADLALAARLHARDMAGRRYFSHVAPGGVTMVDRLRAAGYLGDGRRWWAGEVLAWGRQGLGRPAAIVRTWLRSPPHRRVLLGHRYRDIGVGSASDDPFGGGGTTFTAELGARSR